MSAPVTILYVDDEDINLFLFERSFSPYYRVLTAKSGEEGLAKLATNSMEIIVVITDMRMPGMDGIEFVRKARERFSNIAYYVLTAFNFNDDITKAIDSKLVDKFFTKPFDIELIKQEVNRVAAKLSE